MSGSHSTTTGMTGDGFYNANSAPQWKSIEAVLPWLDAVVGSVPIEGNLATFADFGSSEGRNSIAVAQRMVNGFRKVSDTPIQTVHSDLPTNDFSELFLRLRPDGQSVFGDNEVYSSAVAGSMFDTVLPPGSVQIATTFNAIGFLSCKPIGALPDYILPNGPSAIRKNGSVSAADTEVFAKQAAEDIATFLKARAPELVNQGKVLIQVFGCTDDARTCDGIYDLLNDAVLSYVEDGDISEETYRSYYQPVYFRHLNELTAPLSDPASGVSDLYSLDKAEAYEVPVPFNDAYEKTGDLDIFVRDYVSFFRAFTEAVLFNSLPATPARQSLVDRIFLRAQHLLRENKDRYPFRYASLAMLLTKKS